MQLVKSQLVKVRVPPVSQMAPPFDASVLQLSNVVLEKLNVDPEASEIAPPLLPLTHPSKRHPFNDSAELLVLRMAPP
jgi:hypothetical protein